MFNILRRPKLGADGARVRAAREAAGLSVEKLALTAGVSAGTVKGIERGVVQPRVDTLARLARVLGVEMVTLMHQRRRPESGS